MLVRYQWATEVLSWTVAVVDGRSEAEVIQAYGGDPDEPVGRLPFAAVLNLVPEDELGEYFYAQVMPHDGHVVVMENNGWAGIDTKLAQRVSQHGGRFFAIYWSPSGTRIVEAVDGKLTADFDPLYASGDGEPPTGEMYPEWLGEVAFPMETLEAAMLAALEARTSVAFQREWLERETDVWRVNRTKPITT